jgi:PAS domain S-box-containing protein
MTNRKTYEEAEQIRICQGDIDYQGIVKHVNEGVVIIREEKIVFANSAFLEISQKTPEQVIKVDFSEFVSPSDREKVTRYCTERLFTGDLGDRIEFTMPRAGCEAIIEMKVSVVECGGTPAILGALTDITERRKTRLEMERIKGRLESIIRSMNEVVVSLSPHDYSILAINPAAEALYGVPLRDFTSGRRHVMTFVHPDDQETMERFYQDLPEAEFDEAQYRIVSNNKQVKWVLDEGHVVYSDRGTIRRMDHVIRDITEEKRAIDALTRSEARYRDFFESTSDMAYAVTSEGVFIDINDAGLKLLGFESKEEALASNLKNFYIDMSERAGLLAEINEEGRIEDKRVKFKNKAGEVIEVAITARAKTDDAGYLLYYDGIAHNITKALEDQSNRVLRNAAGGMCHYLNTHLMQLDGSEALMAEDMKAIDGLVEKLAQGENPQEIANQMKELMESMHYFHEGIRGAYDRISEVTKAFNKAFRYTEESYANSTILDIFKASGYEPEDATK